MKQIATILILALTAGCFSPAPEAPVTWYIDADTELVVSSIVVAAPFDSQRLAVLRADGSVVFDAYNSFAARPAALLRSAVRIKSRSPELIVRRLALDCTREGKRIAVVQLSLNRDDQPVIRSTAEVDAADGNYSKAFSGAFAKAVDELRKQLR